MHWVAPALASDDKPVVAPPSRTLSEHPLACQLRWLVDRAMEEVATFAAPLHEMKWLSELAVPAQRAAMAEMKASAALDPAPL